MQSVLGHQAGRPAVRDMTNTGDATRTLNMNQVSTTRYRRHLEWVCVQSVDDAPTHMQCTVKVYFTHFGKYDSSMSIVQSLYCAPPLTTCCYHHWKPLARGVRSGGVVGGVVKARQVIPLQARQDWNSDLPAAWALHWEQNYTALNYWSIL